MSHVVLGIINEALNAKCLFYSINFFSSSCDLDLDLVLNATRFLERSKNLNFDPRGHFGYSEDNAK